MQRAFRWTAMLGAFALAAFALVGSTATASDTPPPTSVTIAGSLQSELGCPGDWDPGCAATHLTYDANDGVWQGTFAVPAGGYEYKAALNGGWDENYGAGAQPNGANIPLSLGTNRSVKFYYDHESHWVTDNVSSTIAVAPGSFQSELGCASDWDPGCLRSWLQDPDGDGVYTFTTTALPAGDYEAKVALDESWDVNYGKDGVPGGANIAFHVPTNGAKTKFSYDAASHVLTIQAGHGADGNVEWDGLRHDSRDLLYRTPGGAVPAGTPVTLRFRTFHDDVTSVRLRVFDVNANAQRIVTMTRAASDVSCYQASLATESCDFWQATIQNPSPNNLWYRFIVSDGSKTVYYGDDTPALDGGLGQPTDNQVDQSWALMAYDPAFRAPAWAKDAVIYQIFPDRFRNGSTANDPKTGDPRYDEPVVKKSWSSLPEGYCSHYDTGCPEGPRGRDYFGGDLDGVAQKLDYLRDLGVNTIYFNPIFAAKSNHRYDTADYRRVDPYLGTQGDFSKLVAQAKQRGIRVVLDGVFNHMSSDSPQFDRYHHYGSSVGACESVSSPYRSWFSFKNQHVPCTTGDYDGWFGFDSIPVLNKSNPDVKSYFVTGTDSISKLWLDRGAAGWRLDVMGDPSFPASYWSDFRQVVKTEKSDALIIGELWQKDTTLLRFLRGDRADSTMNYRLRDAVLGFLAPQGYDAKGFPDSGHPIPASQFAARLSSIREDYPDAAYYSLMNLLDSHDTARLLWQLTPGADDRAAREDNAANVAAGKQRLRLASLIQFALPGAPTVYYGDEVGMTGADDPDDRRTYPWADTGGHPDDALLAHYKALTTLRKSVPALVGGDFRVLLADDSANTVVFGRKAGSDAAVVAVNREGSAQTLHVPVAHYLPDGVALRAVYGGGGATVSGGELVVTVPAMDGVVLDTGSVDLTPPAAPSGLAVASEGDGRVGLSWTASDGAASYAVYRSPVTGGGYVLAGTSTTPSLTDTGLRNARDVYYVVRALDQAGNESVVSNEVKALPHLAIGWSNVQWPPSINHTISVVNRTDNIYGQVWIDGVTNQPGEAPSLRAQLGFGPDGSNPSGNDAWTWVEASFNGDSGNNDEYVASLLPEQTGTFDYAYRYTTTDGRDWVYADLDGSANGYSPAQAGNLVVSSSGDTTPPATPTGFHKVAGSPTAIELGWDAVAGDPTLYGYEVRRAAAAGGPYTLLGRTTAADFVDTMVDEGGTYFYVVRALDLSFNHSPDTAPVSATAETRKVTVAFTVTVPASTDGTGRSVYIAGTLSRLDGGMPDWDPGAVRLTRLDATHWTITASGLEGTQLEYKYTLGDWDHVEKDAACGEIANRQLTLTYGSSGTQAVNDVIPNFRNVAPCGN